MQENAQHVENAATLCTKLRRRRTKSKGKSETSRDRGSRFLKMRNSRNAILKRQTADGESRTQGGNRRLRKMNGVGWLQKSADCGKIDTYGASQGYFRCKSGRECHAGGRFHVLVLHECRRFRTPCFDITRRWFRVLRVCFLHRTAMILRTAHAFISHADGFAYYACAFYIERR